MRFGSHVRCEYFRIKGQRAAALIYLRFLLLLLLFFEDFKEVMLLQIV